MLIRPERPTDIDAIRAVIREAFEDAPHAGGNEQDIVDALRDAGALTVSLVADDEGEVVGHVALSPVTIANAGQWFGLGPIAVAPARQGKGVGSALMRAAIARLQESGAAGCVLLGDPAYYARFGFVPAAPLTFPGPPAESFQVLTLAGDTPAGVVRYHPAFD